MATDTLAAGSRSKLLTAIAGRVSAGMPAPESLSFWNNNLAIYFDSTAELDRWLSAVWGDPKTEVGVTTDADGHPTSWQYRPAGHTVEWQGCRIYPLVIHAIDPDLFTGLPAVGE